jgi:hypothetical protein
MYFAGVSSEFEVNVRGKDCDEVLQLIASEDELKSNLFATLEPQITINMFETWTRFINTNAYKIISKEVTTQIELLDGK